jgi:diguanylate cyclase (GGDEF)-like protein
MQLNALVLSFIVSAGVSAVVAIVAWRRRTLVGARELALLMAAITWWLVANAFEAAALDRSAKIAWSVIAYPGIQAVSVLYLLFVVAWTRQDGWVTRTRIALLSVIPVVAVAMAATNDWHRLLWPAVTLSDAWGVTAVYQRGPWFWVEVLYAYGLVAAGVVALVVATYRYPAVYATRLRLVMAGSLVPVVASVLYAAGLDAYVGADLSSIAFAVAGVIVAWAVLRLRLLDIVPVDWPTLVDSFGDAVLVLDPEARIAALNHAASGLLGIERDVVGQPIGPLLAELPELLRLCREPGDHEAELPMGSGPSGSGQVDRWLNVRITALADGRGRDAGCLVVLRDVTERRQMVETIRTLSLTDELTGLLNRRGFITLANQQLRSSRRTRDRLWLLFADLDGLKDINDRLGHEAGDRALVEVAELLRAGSFRRSDLVARLGGDEFAILATETSPTEGAALAARIEAAVARANEPDGRGGREFALSLSVGSAVFDPERPQTLDELIGEADRRMYAVKDAHRASGTRLVHELDPAAEG